MRKGHVEKQSINVITVLGVIFLYAILAGAPPLFASAQNNEPYPAATYLKATGIGASESEAKLQARAELSRIFETKIISEVINRVQSVVEKSGEETVTRDDEQNIRLLSSGEFKGVKIGMTWYDKGQGAYHALAVLDKNKTNKAWQGELKELNKKIDVLMDSIANMNSAFTRLQTLKRAKIQWFEKEVILSRLRVLGFPEASNSRYDINTIFSMTHEIQTGFLIAVKISGADNKQRKIVRDIISSRLSDEGYLITDNGGKENLIISGTLKIAPVKMNNPGWEFARAILTVAVVDPVTGITVSEVTENKRASHLTYEEAAHKAVKKVAAMAAEKVAESFSAYD